MGKQGTPIEGRSFTSPPIPLRSKVPESKHVRWYREKKRKLPDPRQMLCTDIQVPAEEADKAFMRTWNFLVSHSLRFASSFREMARYGKDELIRYRTREMGRLLERGRIREFDYELMLRVLSHIEVTPVGKLAVIFLTGTQVTVWLWQAVIQIWCHTILQCKSHFSPLFLLWFSLLKLISVVIRAISTRLYDRWNELSVFTNKVLHFCQTWVQ